MQGTTAQELAESLKSGTLPDAQPWEVGAAVRVLCDELARPGAATTVEQARNAAKILNKRLQYDKTRSLAESWSQTRGFDATLERHHAQALVNLGALDAAQQRLEDGLAKIAAATVASAASAAASAASERLEYEGLLGRVEKQRFVERGDRVHLLAALDRYARQYEGEASRPYWHGINVVALLSRARREGVGAKGVESVESLAAEIYAQVTRLHRASAADVWLAATASEACLALDRCDEAELWLYRFLHPPAVQPFDVDSYARQLREIWQGQVAGDGSCASRLTTILSRHVAATQQRWSVSPASVPRLAQALESDPGALEKSFLGETGFGLESARKMLAACASIGCVTSATGERLGTGFLLAGNLLKDSFGAEPVFVTNAHVISDSVPGAIPSGRAFVTFEVDSERRRAPSTCRVGEVLFTSAPGDLGVRCADQDKLDVTVVRLEKMPRKPCCLNLARSLPLIDARSKAYVIGHPRGGGLQISLHDSLLLDVDEDERLVHYRTPTEAGSSGSPVFNKDWELIALHHGGSRTTPRLHGGGTYEANEGIALAAVRRRLDRGPDSRSA